MSQRSEQASEPSGRLRKVAIGIADFVGAIVEYLVSRPALAAAEKIGARMSERRSESGKLRTLWGVTPILTLPLKARCDRALGFASDSLVLTNYYITNDFTWNLKWTRWLVPNSRLQRAVLKLVLAIVLLRYDVIHYFADRGILPPKNGRFGIHPDELRTLESAGKVTYVFTYGADVRTRAKTRALGEWNYCRDCSDPGRYCICDDDQASTLMAATGQHIARFVAMADMLDYVPDPVHLAYWPVDLDRMKLLPQPVGLGGPLKVLHAPNHTHFKGTQYLQRAIDELRQDGIEIDLITMSGVSNQMVLEGMAKADLVVDQLIGGTFGYTALEAMAHGKPVITYVRHCGIVVGFDECPLLNATPENIKNVLAWCSVNKEKLLRIGEQGRVYIEKYHSIPAVAARFAKLYGESMRLSPRVAARLSDFQRKEAVRAGRVEQVSGWRHDWIPQSEPSPKRLTTS